MNKLLQKYGNQPLFYQFLRTMKLTIFILTVSILSSFSAETYSQTTKLTINQNNSTLLNVLKAIEGQSEFKFFYNEGVEVSRTVSVEATQKSVTDLLDKVLSSTTIKYKVLGRQIALYDKNEMEPFMSEQQDKKVSGKVTDQTGASVPGASVVIKGTTKGVVTDLEGSYILANIPANATLQFSFVGMKPQEVLIGDKSTINVILEDVTIGIEEVVAIGYGTQRKREVTGAISSVTSKDVTAVSIISPDQALQGRTAGVQVMQSNGAPGGAVQVQIRGVNSTSSSGNQPLYVLDGVPLSDPGGEMVASAGGSGYPENNAGNVLATINPNDIESMDVLKDASATAIYGARAANGVIVITTKSGKTGKTSFSLDYYRGVQQMQKKWDLQNAVEGMVVRNGALLNTISDFTRNLNPEFFNPFSFATSNTYKNTDWQDVLFRNAPIQDLNFTASGGTEKVRFLVSGNYFDQDGIFLNTYMKRFSNRVNLDVKANDKLSFGIRTTVSYQQGNNVTDGNPYQGVVIGAFNFQAEQAYYPDGSYWNRPNLSSSLGNRNPAFEAMEYTRKIDRFRFDGNVFAEYEILKGLKYKFTFGLDYTTMDQHNLQPAVPRGPYFEIAGPDLGPGNTTKVYANFLGSYNWVMDHTVNFNRSFGKHQIDALVGFSAQQFTNKGTYTTGSGSLVPGLNLVGANNGQNLGASESFSQSGLVSQFARTNYNYMGKYLLTATVRRDGSSNFGTLNRYGIFPSASLGWRLSKERFFEKIGFINDLKVRASYGLTGNQNIGAFRFLSRMSSTGTVFGSTVANGFSPNGLANQSLKWEANKQTDIGLDVEFLKSRIGLTVDYYVKKSKDLLVGIPIPSFSGFSSLAVNLGTIQNKGLEFSLNAHIIEGKSFKWSTNMNVSTLENVVLDLGKNAAGGVNEFYGVTPFTTNGPMNLTKVGLPIASFYGLVTNGIFQTAAETVGYPVTVGMVAFPGDMKYVDQNKDGIINDLDRVVLGSPFPKFFGGITNDFTYKNFTLSVFANFVSGNKIFNVQRLMLEDMLDQGGGANQLNGWTPSNTNTIYPRLTAGGASGYNRLNSNRWIDDGSFLRIRNITLSYMVPAKILSLVKLQSLRVYGSVNNAFTITGYKGWDPEVNSSGSNVLSSGIDQGGYPVARSFILGLNLKF